MTKQNEREQARRLRREEGLSVKAIARCLEVSISSVSVWVRDIELTQEQIKRLEENQEITRAQRLGSQANVTKYRALREQYQQEGRQKAREGNLLHSQGCMLYWAEGTKRRDSIEFVNSDPEMMIFFIRFLREAMQIPEEKIKTRVNCYIDNGLTLEDIKGYWLKLLCLNSDSMRKCNVQNMPVSSQQKGRKLYYGVCHLEVYSIRHLQHIYGAIQEYTGINKPEWLD